jgi:hypothetical protein
MEAGDAVDFPASFTDAGGVAAPDREASLVTMANFIANLKLSQYTLLEIVSGGFASPLFDPAVSMTAVDLEPLLTIYADIADQEEAVLAAFDDILFRAEASSSASYLSPDWMSLRGLTDDDASGARDSAALIFVLVAKVRMAEEDDRADVIADAFLALAESQNKFEARLADPFGVVGSSDDLKQKQKEWRTYAERLAAKVSPEDEQAGREEARKKLADDIRKDLQDWLVAHGAEVTAPHIDRAVDILADDVFESVIRSPDDPAWMQGYVAAAYDNWLAMGYDSWDVATATTDLRECLIAAVAAGRHRIEAIMMCPLGEFWPAGTPAATPSPTPTEVPTATPAATPDTSWIEGYVQGIADGWLAAGYGGIDVAVAADDLRICLTDALTAGASRDAAIGECPTSWFEPQGSPEPTAEPTATPAPTAPPGVVVTATGAFVFGDLGNATLTQNTISLTWNTSGGPIISGSGNWRQEVAHYCGTEWQSWSGTYAGTFDPASNTFSGSYSGTFAVLYFHREPDGSCVEDPASNPSTGGWSATLSGSTVAGEGPQPFNLSVGGGGPGSPDSRTGARGAPFLLDSYARAAIPSPSRMPLLRPLKTE